MRIAEFIKSILAKRSESSKRKEQNSIRQSIYVKECGGSLWLVCNGTAISSVDKQSMSAGDIIGLLESSRNAAVRYSELHKKQMG